MQCNLYVIVFGIYTNKLYDYDAAMVGYLIVLDSVLVWLMVTVCFH